MINGLKNIAYATRRLTGLGLFGLLILLLPGFACGQTWQEFVDQANGDLENDSYQTALVMAARALEMVTADAGRDDTTTANVEYLVGKIHYYLGNFDDAELHWQRTLDIRRRVHGSYHAEVARLLNGLAILDKQRGLYTEAEPLYEEAIEIREQVYGPDHPLVAQYVNNIANLYMLQGRYREAEARFQRALEIMESAMGENDPEVAASLNNLAALYQMQGRYADVEPLYLRSLQIWQDAYGSEHPLVAQALNNLAYLYHALGRYEEAEDLYQRALVIRETTLRPDHPDVSRTLNNLSRLYRDQGRYADAEPLVRRALKIGEVELGSEHSEVAEFLKNLGDILLLQGRRADALPIYRQALEIFEKAVGVDHPYTAGTLHGLAMLALGDNNWQRARDLQRRAYEIRRENFREGFAVLSERSALEYSQFLQSEAANYLSILLDSPTHRQALHEEIAGVVFSVKGQVSDGIFSRHRAISMMLATSDSLRATRSELSDLYVQGPGSEGAAAYGRKIEELTRKKERFEAALARGSSGMSEDDELWDVTGRKVGGRLPEGCVLIEFMKYEHRISPDQSEPRYLAVTVSRDNPPRDYALGSAALIDSAVSAYRAHFQNPLDIDLEAYSVISRNLHDLIWKPLSGELTSAGSVFIAPDGAISLVSFAGLLDEAGNYLIEQFPIHYLSSGRDVVRFRGSARLGSGLLAIGDPDYDAATGKEAGMLERLTASMQKLPLPGFTRNVRSGCEALNQITVARLPGTRDEVQRVAKRWAEISDEPVEVFLDREASEEIFKSASAGKRVVHLATHGYYITEDCKPEHGTSVSPGENPLLLSGLFLAGANQKGREADEVGAEDGIVTAEEVAGMNFHGVQLVILSACETGLGEVRAGEGVYGLRRAFQMAGARTVLSALWQVDDRVTADLMSELFTSSYPTVAESMRAAAMKQITSRRARNESDHPFFWAAFIATGGWRMR